MRNEPNRDWRENGGKVPGLTFTQTLTNQPTDADEGWYWHYLARLGGCSPSRRTREGDHTRRGARAVARGLPLLPPSPRTRGTWAPPGLRYAFFLTGQHAVRCVRQTRSQASTPDACSPFFPFFFIMFGHPESICWEPNAQTVKVSNGTEPSFSTGARPGYTEPFKYVPKHEPNLT